MAERCAGCMNKYKLFEKPRLCVDCQKPFCSVCLPRGKKGKKSQPPARELCVYCSRQQKTAKLTEEADVMEHFQDRFYNRAHTTPPIQTKLQLDFSKMKSDRPARVEPKLSEEDRMLEERLRRLKESHKTPATTSYSEDEIRDKLSKLRGDGAMAEAGQSQETQPPTKSGQEGRESQEAGKTQFEEAQNLMKKASDEVELDERLAETNLKKDENLHNRLQVLKGREPSSKQGPLRGPDPDIQKFLEDMEIQITDDDPEALLEDLRGFQKKEEGHALAEAESTKVQSLIDTAHELERQDAAEEISSDAGGHPITPYPTIPVSGVTTQSEGDPVSKAEIANVIKQAVEEIKADKQREAEDQAFIKGTAERLAKLKSRGDEEGVGASDSDCVVQSKLTPRGIPGSCNIDFSWSHFGAMPTTTSTSGPTSAAQQLGITASGDFGDDDEVQALLQQVMAEATLDDKLEASGYDRYLEDSRDRPQSNKQREPKPQAGGASAAAAAAYVPSWGGDDDELPWCCICNNDAILRCHDCDGDLYCTKCFSEGHEQFGLFDHRYVSYEPPERKAM